MKALTESELRQIVRERGELDSITVPPGTLITPAARQFLQERRIKLHFGEDAGTGKPEHMTHLNHKSLVPKTHPRIRLRGKLDSLEAHILLAQLAARKEGLAHLDKHLGEVLDLVRQILRSEVLDEPLPPISLFGLDEAQLREQSHHPETFCGIGHTMPSVAHGEVLLWLNLVRTQVRETELAAAEAFCREGAPPERPDLLQALNRLSSALWILMMRHLAKKEGRPNGSF